MTPNSAQYNATLTAIKARGFFIVERELPTLISLRPLGLLLVRCGGGRFMAPADQVKHFIDIIEREGSDHLRDVSFPAGTFEEWQNIANAGTTRTGFQSTPARPPSIHDAAAPDQLGDMARED